MLGERQVRVVKRARELIEQSIRDEREDRFRSLNDAYRACYRILRKTKR